MLKKFEYDDSHPHYTPDWLSERVAKLVPRNFSGTVIDPACGAGNLLIAAALRLDDARQAGKKIDFIGVDVSVSAVKACRAAFKKVEREDELTVAVADFLEGVNLVGFKKPRLVVMNPPFLGYSSIGKLTRRMARSELGLNGRFNLSHIFVIKAIRDLKPEKLFAILPSNWHFSAESDFRDRLSSLGGSWTWRDVGDAFSGVSAHVGLLSWSSASQKPRSVGKRREPKSVAGYEVRHGVATGRDSVFRELALTGFAGGSVVLSVVGRDLARGTASPIWLPPRTKKGLSGLEQPANHLHRKLKARACVRSGKRNVLAYHENFPNWFLSGPKLLLPEVVARDLRVELDRDGSLLPLHSVIAIQVPTVADGESLKEFLLAPKVLSRFRRRCPRLSGGAVRLNVGEIRKVVVQWHRGERRIGLQR